MAAFVCTILKISHRNHIYIQFSPPSAGHDPRLSKVNLFTLLSLWMELFPQEEPDEEEEEEEDHRQVGAQNENR